MSEQQEFLNSISSIDDPVILLVVLHLRQQKLELDAIAQELEIKKQKIQPLKDICYINTHCACRTCGALPNNPAQESEDQDYEEKLGYYVRQSKL